MSLLIPEIGLLFWMSISFLIVFGILAKFGFPIITKAVEKRNSYIHDSLEKAREAEARIVAVQTEAEKILEKARTERNKILNEAREIQKQIEQEAKTQAEQQAIQQIHRAEAEIEESKQRALDSVKDEIAGISVKIAEKLLSEQLKNDKAQKAFINHLLEEELNTN